MKVRDYLQSHPEVALWLLGVAGVSALATVSLGYVVMYRIPDQETRQREIVAQIEKSERLLEAKIEATSKEVAKVFATQESQSSQVARWREQLNDRVKTVHLIACEAARKRSGECARLIVMQTVQSVVPQAVQHLASVQVTVTDNTKPIITNEAVASAIGVLKTDPPTTEAILTDFGKMQNIVGALSAAEASLFVVENGVIKVKFANGLATLTPTTKFDEIQPVTIKLNLMASMLKRYGDYEKHQTAGGTIASVKANAAYTDIQRLSVELNPP